MRKTVFQNTAVFSAVFLLHIALLTLVWHTPSTIKNVGMEDIVFVDLGSLGNGLPSAETAPVQAAEPSKPQPKPIERKPEPVKPEKTVKPVEKKVSTVRTQQKEADFHTEKKIAPQKTVTETTPKPATEPQPKTVPSTDAPSSSGGQSGKAVGTGTGLGSGTGSGSGSGSGKGSSAGNPVRAAGSIPTPPYPPLSQAENEQGTVVLEVLVAPGGKVQNVRVARSSGYRRLDRAAVQGARNGRFEASVWTAFKVSVKFSLD